MRPRVQRSAGLAAALGLAAFALAQCGAGERIEPEIWGCDGWAPDGACEVFGARRLGVFLPATTAAVSVHGWPVDRVGPSALIEGGRAVTVEVSGGGRLLLRAGEAYASVVVERLDEDSPRARLRGALDADDRVEVLRLAAEMMARGPPEDAAAARSAEARVAIRDARYVDATGLLADAMARWSGVGRPREAAADRAAAAWVELEGTGNLTRGFEVLTASAAVPHTSEAWARLEHARALSLGNTPAALDIVRAVRRRASALGAGRMVRDAWSVEAALLLDLADPTAALALADDIRADVLADPCDLALADDISVAAAFALAERRAASPELLDAARRSGERGLARGCDVAYARTTAVLNFALLALAAGDLPAAEAWARELDAAPEHARWFELWRAELAARLLVGAGRTEDALARYRGLLERADAGRDDTATWLAEVGTARAAWLLGERERALAAGARAHRLASALEARAGLGGDQTGTTQLVEGGSADHAARLLEVGDVSGALAVVRDLQARAFRQAVVAARLARQSPETRALIEKYRRARAAEEEARAGDWAKSTEELKRLEPERAELHRQEEAALARALSAVGTTTCAPAALSAREVALVLHEWAGRAVVFAVVGEGVRGVVALEPGADLAVFDALLAGADRVRLIEPASARVDLAALPWRGRPLGEQRVVRYGLDGCARDTPQPEARAVLWVEDPRGTFEHAGAEAAGVEGVVHVAGRAATLDMVSRLLVAPEVALFHFTGHGRYEGADGAGSILALAGDASLTVPDVLALERVPPRAILSACETGVSRRVTAGRGLGMGQALVVQGAREVLVTTATVSDRAGALLMPRVHAGLARGADLAAALHEATASLVVERPDIRAALRPYRVIVP